MSNMTPHFFGNFWTTLIFGPDRAVSRAEPSRVNRPESQKGDSFPEIVLTHEKHRMALLVTQRPFFVKR